MEKDNHIEKKQQRGENEYADGHIMLIELN